MARRSRTHQYGLIVKDRPHLSLGKPFNINSLNSIMVGSVAAAALILSSTGSSTPRSDGSGNLVVPNRANLAENDVGPSAS